MIESHEIMETTVAQENVGHETTGHEAAPADESVIASLGLNASMFGWQLFNFALVAAIVWFLILKPLTKKMDERKKIIDESLDRAEIIASQVTKSKEEYDAAIAKAKADANEVLATAKADAEEYKNKMKETTKAEIESLVLAGKKQLATERETMMAEVRAELAGLVTGATEKILRTKMDDKSDQKLISDTVKSME